MDRDEVYTLAIALSKANGHPDPEAHAALVVDHFDNPEGLPEVEVKPEGEKAGA